MQPHRSNRPYERDIDAQAADDLDPSISALPADSPWRVWLANPSHVLRAPAGLPVLREAQGGER
jgi:hypothetical protein